MVPETGTSPLVPFHHRRNTGPHSNNARPRLRYSPHVCFFQQASLHGCGFTPGGWSPTNTSARVPAGAGAGLQVPAGSREWGSASIWVPLSLSEVICPRGALPVFGSEQPGPQPARFWQARSCPELLAELMAQAAHCRLPHSRRGRGWGREQGPSPSSLTLRCAPMAHVVFIHNYNEVTRLQFPNRCTNA